jgi:hypothetical protein
LTGDGSAWDSGAMMLAGQTRGALSLRTHAVNYASRQLAQQQRRSMFTIQQHQRRQLLAGWSNASLLRRQFHASVVPRAPLVFYNGQSPTLTRTTALVSERDAAHRDGPEVTRQRAFKHGVPVPYRTKGSVRPDHYRDGVSTEVKNYNVETPEGRGALVHNVTKQAKNRRDHLPTGTVQKVVVDARGQTVAIKHLDALIERIVANSDGTLHPDNVTVWR